MMYWSDLHGPIILDAGNNGAPLYGVHLNVSGVVNRVSDLTVKGTGQVFVYGYYYMMDTNTIVDHSYFFQPQVVFHYQMLIKMHPLAVCWILLSKVQIYLECSYLVFRYLITFSIHLSIEWYHCLHNYSEHAWFCAWDFVERISWNLLLLCFWLRMIAQRVSRSLLGTFRSGISLQTFLKYLRMVCVR